MSITIRQVGNKEYPNLGNPIECLIQSTEVSRPDFKLRARVLVNGTQRADLRFPALGTQYFRFDIAPIVRDYASYLLKDTTTVDFEGNFRLILSELFTSGSVTVEQSSTTSNLYSTVDAAEGWNEFIKDTNPQASSFLINSSVFYLYKNFSRNIISCFIDFQGGSQYAFRINGSTFANYTPEGNGVGVYSFLISNYSNIAEIGDFQVFKTDDQSGQPLISKIYKTINPCTRFGRYGLTFKNSWGGYEPLYLIRFAHIENQAAERTYYTRTKGNRVGNTIEYKQHDIGKAAASRVVKNRTVKLTTDFMNDEQMAAFIGVMDSPEVYLYDEQMTGGLLDRLTPVRVMTGSMERKYREKDGLFFAEIEVMLDDELIRYGS